MGLFLEFLFLIFCLVRVSVSSVAQSCLTLSSPMDYSMPGFLVHHELLELAQTHVHWVGDAIQPTHPLSSPSPPAFNLSQVRVFSNESVLPSGGQCIGALASASVFPVNTQDLIFFRVDWFDLLAVQGVLKSFLQHHISKASVLRCSALWSNSHTHTWVLEKP